jgi:hypothetical protein
MRLAVRAHRSFADRVVIGWDIEILDDGSIIVEIYHLIIRRP